MKSKFEHRYFYREQGKETPLYSKEGGDMRVLSLMVICIVLSVASLAWGGSDERVNIAPDGTYVYGRPQIAPDGSYVGGHPQITPDGSYVGSGRVSMAPDGSYVGGRPNLAPDGSYVGGKPVMTPAGDYVGTDGTD